MPGGNPTTSVRANRNSRWGALPVAAGGFLLGVACLSGLVEWHSIAGRGGTSVGAPVGAPDRQYPMSFNPDRGLDKPQGTIHEYLIRHAYKSFSDADFRTAIVLLTKLVEESPDDLAAISLLGRAYEAEQLRLEQEPTKDRNTQQEISRCSDAIKALRKALTPVPQAPATQGTSLQHVPNAYPLRTTGLCPAVYSKSIRVLTAILPDPMISVPFSVEAQADTLSYGGSVLRNGAKAGPSVTMMGDGNVGIGTTSPRLQPPKPTAIDCQVHVSNMKSHGTDSDPVDQIGDCFLSTWDEWELDRGPWTIGFPTAGREVAYSDAGLIDTIHTQFVYDTRGSRVTNDGATTRTTAYAYDAHGNLTSMTRSGYVCDTRGSRVTNDRATTGTTAYVYDALDRMTSMTRRGYVCDTSGGRVTNDGATTRTTAYAYDAHGNLTSMTRSGYVYDTRGSRVTNDRATTGTTAYVYDALGRMTSSGLVVPTETNLNPRFRHWYESGLGEWRTRLLGNRRLLAVASSSDSAVSGLDPLPYSALDAQRVAKAFRQCGYRSEVLPNAHITRSDILAALRAETLASRAGDSFVLYLSGHGFSDANGIQALVTHGDGANGVEALSLNAIQVALANHRGNVVIIVDSCSDRRMFDLREYAMDVEPRAAGKRALLFLSTNLGEKAFQSESLRSSYFTHSLVNALAERVGKETDEPLRLDFESLFRKVQADTTALAAHYGVSQTPTMLPAGVFVAENGSTRGQPRQVRKSGVADMLRLKMDLPGRVCYGKPEHSFSSSF